MAEGKFTSVEKAVAVGDVVADEATGRLGGVIVCADKPARTATGDVAADEIARGSGRGGCRLRGRASIMAVK